MCFHSNQHPWAIKNLFIILHSKYQSLKFSCLPVMNSPVFPSLDDIYCTFPTDTFPLSSMSGYKSLENHKQAHRHSDIFLSLSAFHKQKGEKGGKKGNQSKQKRREFSLIFHKSTLSKWQKNSSRNNVTLGARKRKDGRRV